MRGALLKIGAAPDAAAATEAIDAALEAGDVGIALQTLTAAQTDEVFGALTAHVTAAAAAGAADEGEDAEDGADAQSARYKLYTAAAGLGSSYLASLAGEGEAGSGGGGPRPSAGSLAAALHAQLFFIEGPGAEPRRAQSAVARLCEEWWEGGHAGREGLTNQLLPCLLVRALGGGAREADLKRLYAVRGALACFDYDDESSDSLKELLLRCFISPLFLRSADGRRFLVRCSCCSGGRNARVCACSFVWVVCVRAHVCACVCVCVRVCP